MAAITEPEASRTFTAPDGLPEDRAEWPDEAGREYGRLLRELNAWSREHDWPMSSNAWIAEETVRRCW